MLLYCHEINVEITSFISNFRQNSKVINEFVPKTSPLLKLEIASKKETYPGPRQN